MRVIAKSILFKPGCRLACELAHHGSLLRVTYWGFRHGRLLHHYGKENQCTLHISCGLSEVFYFGFEFLSRYVLCTVAYGVEKISIEVSTWMRTSTVTIKTSLIYWVQYIVLTNKK